jgi:putative thioredoxin
MQRRPTDLNIAGAVDLSGLRAPARPAVPTPTPAAAPAGGAAPAAASSVLDVSEATFERDVLQRSMQVPVLVDFWADWCGPCKQLSPVLERLAEADGGAWLLAKVDVDANQQLSGQLGIQSIPTVLLALGGRLIQGFTGALPERDVRAFLDQVLAAAQQAGLPGPGAAGAPDEPAGPPPEPELLAAEDALARDDLPAAEAAYDALLARKPADPVALGGRAWVGLIRRTEGLDPQQVLQRAAADPSDVTAQLSAADLDVLADRVDEAVSRLVALVRRTSGEEREAVRTHLVGLFSVLDPEDPRVVAGRRALANALF